MKYMINQRSLFVQSSNDIKQYKWQRERKPEIHSVLLRKKKLYNLISLWPIKCEDDGKPVNQVNWPENLFLIEKGKHISKLRYALRNGTLINVAEVYADPPDYISNKMLCIMYKRLWDNFTYILVTGKVGVDQFINSLDIMKYEYNLQSELRV